jgi:hypothetical protein
MTTATLPLRAYGSRLLTIVLLGATVLSAVLLVALILDRDGGPARGSGVPAEETRTVPPFSAVDLSGKGEVMVHVGPTRSVRVTADDNLIGRVGTSVRRDTLVVSTRGSFEPVVPLTVEVTVPELAGATLSGVGSLDLDGVQAETFRLRLTGVGLVVATGTAGNLDASLAGVGEASLESPVARDVVATLSGDGRLGVHATRSLAGILRGAGEIVYVGHPKTVSRDITGTGAIIEG